MRLLVRSPAIGSEKWRRDVQRYSLRILNVLGIRVVTSGAHPLTGGPGLLVADDDQWLAALALLETVACDFVVSAPQNAFFSARVARALGVLYPDARNAAVAGGIKGAVARRLVSGGRVALALDRKAVLRESHVATSSYQAAVDAVAPVQAVTVRYREETSAGAFRDIQREGLSVLAIFRRALAGRQLDVELTFDATVYAGDRTADEIAARVSRFLGAEGVSVSPMGDRLVA